MSKEEKGLNITPAAMVAALAGDVENFIAAATPGGIEKQEAAGQHWLQKAGLLPNDFGYRDKEKTKKEFEDLGFVFGEEYDECFVKGSLPEGWSMDPTEHSYWTEIFDEKGRKRASIFYKAAFYDRKAHMSLQRRFTQETVPVDQSEEVFYEEIVDGKNGKTVFTSSSYRSLPKLDLDAYRKAEKEVQQFSKENNLDNRGWNDE
jgi:hypothetical protein